MAQATAGQNAPENCTAHLVAARLDGAGPQGHPVAGKDARVALHAANAGDCGGGSSAPGEGHRGLREWHPQAPSPALTPAVGHCIRLGGRDGGLCLLQGASRRANQVMPAHVGGSSRGVSGLVQQLPMPLPGGLEGCSSAVLATAAKRPSGRCAAPSPLRRAVVPEKRVEGIAPAATTEAAGRAGRCRARAPGRWACAWSPHRAGCAGDTLAACTQQPLACCPWSITAGPPTWSLPAGCTAAPPWCSPARRQRQLCYPPSAAGSR